MSKRNNSKTFNKDVESDSDSDSNSSDPETSQLKDLLNLDKSIDGNNGDISDTDSDESSGSDDEAQQAIKSRIQEFVDKRNNDRDQFERDIGSDTKTPYIIGVILFIITAYFSWQFHTFDPSASPSE